MVISNRTQDTRKSSQAGCSLTLTGLGAQGDVLLSRAGGGLLGRHFEIE